MEYPVIISYSNHGYYGFARNMLINLDRTLKNHKVHFYCLDDEIYNKLTATTFNNLHVIFEKINTPEQTSKNFEKYGTANYNSITHTKVNILRDALTKYDWIHFIDCDVVCVREPDQAHYHKYKEYDIVFQHDAGMYSADKLHAPTLHHIWCCTGNTTLRNTAGTHYVLDRITEYQHKHKNKNDQECLYQYFQDIGIKDLRDYAHAKLYTYEIREYTNGFWLDRNIGTLDQTYFFHANHVSGVEKKLNLLKKANQLYL
jgi:hypothetical protein